MTEIQILKKYLQILLPTIILRPVSNPKYLGVVFYTVNY